MKAHLSNDELILHGPVGVSMFDDDGLTAADVRAAIAGLSGDLVVRLKSGGGDPFEGAAIHAVLSGYEGSKEIVVEGIAASAASLIAMVGDKIVMSEGAIMMIHDPSGGTYGPPSEHLKSFETLTALADEYAGLYARRAGKPVDDVREAMKAEIWLNGDQAVEEGYATHSVKGATPAMAAAFPYNLYKSAPAHLMTMAKDKGWLAATPQIERAETPKPPAAPVAPIQEAVMADELTPAGEKTPEKKVEMTAEQIAIIGADARRKVVMAMNAKNVLNAAQVEKVVAETSDEADAKMKAADLIVDARLAQEGPQTVPTAEITADVKERFKQGVTKGLMHRAGMGGERNEFTGMTLRETARASLDVHGVKPSGHSALDMVATAFTMAGGMHSPGDFASILADVANKAMLRGYEEAEETFQTWTVEGSVSDFKPTKRVDLDTFPSLREVPDGAEYKYATVGDHGETITIATYGELFNISRQTVINDDLGAFTRIPQKMGRAAIRTVGNLAYAVLTDNANMSDGVALFDATHNNLAGSGAAPSVTSFNSAFEAMMKQKDRAENAHALNIVPRYGLFPVGLRSQALQVLNSEYDPAKSTRAANTARNMIEPIVDARLTGNAWYFVADPSRIDTVEVSYLDGNSAPFLDQTETWTRDGASFKVRIDAGVKALAWQGLYKDPGA